MNKLQVHFLGASETVTGSKYLVESNDVSFLVDCGLFQGIKELREKNWDVLPIDIATLDFVLLTHGHLDHTGYLPKLMSMGFKGAIYGTAPTLAIAEVILKDSAKIQEEEAERANEEGFSKHHPAEPLYTLDDVEYTLSRFKVVEVDTWIKIKPDVEVRFQTVGHILGACFIEIKTQGKRLVFSGDVGREIDDLLFAPKRPTEADYLFIESTYGDRLHPNIDPKQALKEIILSTLAKNGSLIIPSFAVERAQEIMYLIWQLSLSGEIPSINSILDTPMGAKVLGIFEEFASWHRLDKIECYKMFASFKIVKEFANTLQLMHTKTPKIVIAGSGMVTGGRVLSYLTTHIEDPNNTVLLVGYQGEGTRGRQLQEGCHEVKIFGKYYPVRAKIEMLQNLSAHADQNELLNWVKDIKTPPKKVFLIHGERQALDAFRVKLTTTLGWNCTIPTLYQIVDLLEE